MYENLQSQSCTHISQGENYSYAFHIMEKIDESPNTKTAVNKTKETMLQTCSK